MKLTAKKRNALSKNSFALPGKRAYPINDKGHAVAALGRVKEFGTPSEQEEVESKVHKKFPAMGKK